MRRGVPNGIVLYATDGVDEGRKVIVEVGQYRVIGRQDGVQFGTFIVPRGEQRRLEREDHGYADAHLQRRAARADGDNAGLLGARSEVAHFTRGGDVDLMDEAVSQTHAMVFCDEAGASIVDVASTNGTFVNGDKVQEAILSVGDLLRVGETRFEVRAADGLRSDDESR